jgi:hypothetical protein
MKRSLDAGWAGMGLMIIWLIFLGYLMSGCATLSIKPPTIQDTAQTAGYIVALKNPDLVEEFIHHTTVGKEDVLVLYPNWKRYLAYRLGEEDFLVVKSLLTLVDIRLEFKTDEQREAIIRELFREFVAGLEAGINAHN